MANNYASGTFAPLIPSDLITTEFETLADALGVTVNRPDDDGKMAYLFNDGYCSSGYIENEDGTEKEVTDEDLYAAIQDIIRRSSGRLTWVSHEQAYTCDKMRAGEFGGSAVFITADDIQYHGTSSWLERRIYEAEIGDTGPDTEDTTTVNVNDVIESTNDLIDAAKLVVERWTSGDLAQAVNNLHVVAGWTEQTLEDYEPAVAPQPDINKELLQACIQARAALPDAWAAVQCDTPKEVIDLLNRAIARAESVDQVEPIISSQAATLLKDLVEMISEVEDIEHDQFGCQEECPLCAAKNYIVKIEEGQPSPINLAIVLDGGLVQAVVTDAPEAFKGINTMIIDYDCDAADPHDDTLGIIPQSDGGFTEAFIQKTFIDRAGIDLSLVNDFIRDKRYGSQQERIAVCDEDPCEGCKDCNTDGKRCVNEDKCLAWQWYNN